jgi:probable rRNA maturation factor
MRRFEFLRKSFCYDERMPSTLDVRNFTRAHRIPAFSYDRIARTILPDWEISLVFIGERRAQKLNKQLRNKEYIPNVLSYEIGKNSGEILICPHIALRQAGSYGLSYRNYVAFLFIHGLLHLKGLSHGTTMERHERTFLKRFTGVDFTYGDEPQRAHGARKKFVLK